VPFSFGENNFLSYESYGVYLYYSRLPKLASQTNAKPTPTPNQRQHQTNTNTNTNVVA
jgi:hypothetical protein